MKNPDEFPHLDLDYTFFFGGVSEDVALVPGSLAANSPYIGCMRDILIRNQMTDFNAVEHATGIEKGICKSEIPVDTGDEDEESKEETTG